MHFLQKLLKDHQIFNVLTLPCTPVYDGKFLLEAVVHYVTMPVAYSHPFLFLAAILISICLPAANIKVILLVFIQIEY